MKLEPRKPSGREKDEESIRLLAQLREKLHSDNSSVARRAAFNLAWMQEDGLEVIEEALFDFTNKRTKNAAAYGLRNMHGRMKKKARELLGKGLKCNNSNTREICKRALDMIDGRIAGKEPYKNKNRKSRLEIKEIRRKTRRVKIINKNSFRSRPGNEYISRK